MTGNIENDPFSAKVREMLDDLYSKVDDAITRQEKNLEANKKKNELETKRAQELKLNNELRERLAKVSARDSEVEKACSALKMRLTIADSDQNRLETAKDMYQIGKELTGIRWDFNAPPDVAKGYVKSESRKLLSSFEFGGGVGGAGGTVGAGGAEPSAALWAHVAAAAAPAWHDHAKENTPHN